MKHILFSTFLTAIFASGALGQDFGSGIFGYWSSYDTLIHEGVIYSVDEDWQYGYSSIVEYGNRRVLSLDLDAPLQHQGEWQIQVMVDKNLSWYGNCLHNALIAYYYKLFGANDSAGIVLEASWDGNTWYNTADSAEVERFRDTLGYHIYPNSSCYYPDSSLVTVLPDGRKAYGSTTEWYDFGMGTCASDTWAGVGSLNAMYIRFTFVNYSSQPVYLAFKEYTVRADYWCEYLDIQEQKGRYNINLYPNPVTECSVLEIPETLPLPAKLEIYSIDGTRVFEHEFGTSRSFAFYNTNLPNGLYMYTISNENSLVNSGKFVVSH